MTEDEMDGWPHLLNRHEFEPAPGDGEGQGRLACCSPRGRKESDTTYWLSHNNNEQCRVTKMDKQASPCLKFLSPWPTHSSFFLSLECH